MKFIISTFIIVLFSMQFFAQQDSILTKAENLAWLENFKKIETRAEQVEAIKAKIIADSSDHKKQGITRIVGTKETWYKSDSLFKAVLENPQSECKILFLYNGVILDYEIYPKKIDIISFFNASNIDLITVIEEDIAMALYGVRGSCGVVVISSANRRLKRKIRRL